MSGMIVEFHIMRAFYGGAGHFVDITEILRGYKHEGHLFLVVDNRSMGGIPIRMCVECCACFIGTRDSAGRLWLRSTLS